MTPSRDSIEQDIKAKLVEIVDQLGDDARSIEVTDIIPATGLIDSAGLIELLGWYEGHFRLELKQEEITIDNLGTISDMAGFVLARHGVGRTA